MVTLNADTIVSEIDTDDMWFISDDTDRIVIPGDVPGATVSRRQAATIINGIKYRADNTNKYLASTLEAAIVGVRREVGLSANQWNFTLVQKFLSDSQKQRANDELTDGQGDVVANYMRALSGMGDFWDAQVDANIKALDPAVREKYLGMFEDIDNQGQLNSVLKKMGARVGDPSNPASNVVLQETINDLIDESMMDEEEDDAPDEDPEDPTNV